MARFNTGNPIDSKDPRDLSDNAQNIDQWANSESASFSDRLGVDRRTLHGMDDEFQSFLDGSAYDFSLGDYESGIEVTSRNQVIRENGEFWRAAAETELPYTTDGSGMPEGGAFVSVGDATLRDDLASSDGLDFIGGTGNAATRGVGTGADEIPDNTALDSRGFAQSVDSVEDLRASSFPDLLERIWLSGYYGVGTPGGGPLYIDRDDTTSEDNGGTVFVNGDGVRFKRPESESGSLYDFGAVGDGVADDTDAVQAAVNTLSVTHAYPATYIISDKITVADSKAIIGGGRGSLFRSETVSFAAGIESGMVEFSGRGSRAHGIRVDLRFDNDGPTLVDNRSSGFAFLEGSSDNLITHCWADNATQHGVLFLGENNWARNVFVNGANRYFVSFGLGTVAPNITKRCGIEGLFADTCHNSAAIEINDGVEDIKVSVVRMRNAPQGILIHDHTRPDENNYNIFIDDVVATEINGSLLTITAAEAESLQFAGVHVRDLVMEAVPGVIAYAVDIQGNQNAVSSNVFIESSRFSAIRTLRLRDVENVRFSDVDFVTYDDAETLAGGSISTVQTFSRIKDVSFRDCWVENAPRIAVTIESGGYSGLSYTGGGFKNFANQSTANGITVVSGITEAESLSFSHTKFFGGANAQYGFRLRDDNGVTVVGCQDSGLAIGLYLADETTNFAEAANVSL